MEEAVISSSPDRYDKTARGNVFLQYLRKGESVWRKTESLIVNGEAGYTSAVTDQRVIIVKESNLDEISIDESLGTEWELKKKGVYLWAGVILIILGGFLDQTFGIIFGALSLLLWLVDRRRVSLTISTSEKRFHLHGSIDYLEYLNEEIHYRRQETG